MQLKYIIDINQKNNCIVIFGIALLSAGILLILGNLAEKTNQGIKNYLVKKE